MKGPSLKERFASFMASGDFAEDIDALVKTGYPVGLQKADYLAAKRSAIIELKSLDQDVDVKVQSLLDELTENYGPLDREQVTLAGIIDAVAQLPRGNSFKPKLRAILTQRIDDILAKADKQARDTRKFFDLPNAIGAVVVLNERAALIEPDYFQDKAYDMLRKEVAPGQHRYPENQVVILISEAHRVVTAPDREEIPVETAISDVGRENPAVEAFAAELLKRWAEFNGAIASELAGVIRDVTTRDAPPLFKTA